MPREISGEFLEHIDVELSQDPEDSLEEYNVVLSQDTYDAVLVAAFGGLVINLSEDVKLKVHPAYLFCLTLPLFSIQLSLIMFIDLSLSPLEPVRDAATTSELVFKTKLLIVFVMQLTLFKEMLQAVRLLFFAANPFTWKDFKRNHHKQEDSLMYEPLALAPFPILASFMKITVCYMVMSSSVSIILTARDASDAIFDGLAITFIADLDETFWVVFGYLFHIKFPDFAFQRINKGRDSRRWPQEVGSALTFVAMFLLYLRQICVVTFAIITNVIPLARDLCTWRRWLQGEAHNFGVAAAIFRFCDHHFLILDPASLILHKGEDQLGEGKDLCSMSETDPKFMDVATEPKYERMMVTDMVKVFVTYPVSSFGITIMLLFVIAFPQLIHVGFQKLYRSPRYSSPGSERGYSSLRRLHPAPLQRNRADNEWGDKSMGQLEQELALLKLLQKNLTPGEVTRSIELCSKAMRERDTRPVARSEQLSRDDLVHMGRHGVEPAVTDAGSQLALGPLSAYTQSPSASLPFSTLIPTTASFSTFRDFRLVPQCCSENSISFAPRRTIVEP